MHKHPLSPTPNYTGTELGFVSKWYHAYVIAQKPTLTLTDIPQHYKQSHLSFILNWLRFVLTISLSEYTSYFRPDASCKSLRRQSYIKIQQIFLLKSALSALPCFKIELYRLSRTTITVRETGSSLLKIKGNRHICLQLRKLITREQILVYCPKNYITNISAKVPTFRGLNGSFFRNFLVYLSLLSGSLLSATLM